MKLDVLSKINKDDGNYLLLLFVAATIARLIPELIAYPYPIGYDVINYYIPVIANFDNHWSMVSGQFPLYVSLLNLVTIATSLDPHAVVSVMAILIFGFFSIAVYETSKRLLHLDQLHSLYIALFVIFQISVLRTSWDLHRDMLSLTIMLFVLSFGANNKKISKKIFIFVIMLSVVSVMADRMIGLLLTASLLIYAAVVKDKKHIILATVTSIVFLMALLQGVDKIEYNIPVLSGVLSMNNNYNPLNLLILFLLTSSFLIPTGILGFLSTHQLSLKIPVLLSLFGSFSWVIFPYSSSLLPDRWTFIFSILLSIFAGYGVIILVNKLVIFRQERHNLPFIVTFFVVAAFVIMGILFAVTSNDNPISLFVPFHRFVGQFGPLSMQYNSISIPESKSIVSALEWINHNTPIGSTIIIDKHWRGWTEVELQDRKFQFYEEGLKHVENGKYYLLKLDAKTVPYYKNSQIHRVYSNEHFSLYKIRVDTLV